MANERVLQSSIPNGSDLINEFSGGGDANTNAGGRWEREKSDGFGIKPNFSLADSDFRLYPKLKFVIAILGRAKTARGTTHISIIFFYSSRNRMATNFLETKRCVRA